MRVDKCTRLIVLPIVLIVACGGGSLSLSEYAAEVEALVAEMEAGFESIDARWESQAPTIDGAREYWDDRMEIRTGFLEDIRSLEPPDEIAAMHDEALDLFRRITEADEALSRRVETFETITEHDQWLDTTEGRASLAILEDVFAFCRESQAQFDATEEREQLEDVAWLPPEMKDVVKVAFGCPQR